MSAKAGSELFDAAESYNQRFVICLDTRQIEYLSNPSNEPLREQCATEDLARKQGHRSKR